ncbi:hypothetical protein KJ591_03985 [Patescibacteria group bacterium]|nr:hypothetical protein [Patescibacteria group bacterium]
MKRKTAGLVIVALVLAFVATTMAQTPPMFDSLQNRCFNGFEVDLQIGVPSPPFFEADFGMLTRGYFNLGVGVSFANIQAEPMAGGYAKIGILTFDIMEGKFLAGLNRRSYYGEFEIKAPIPVYIMSKDTIWPMNIGYRYTELMICGQNTIRSKQHVFFVGVDAIFVDLGTEVWVEAHFPYELFCYRIFPPLHIEFGFAYYF